MLLATVILSMKRLLFTLLLPLILGACSGSSDKNEGGEKDDPDGNGSPEAPAEFELPPPPYEEGAPNTNEPEITMPEIPQLPQPQPPVDPDTPDDPALPLLQAIDSTPMAIDDSLGALIDFPQSAMDADGNAFVVWANQTATALNVFARRYDVQNRTWGSPTTLGVGAIGDLPQSPTPQIALLPAGEALVIWRQRETPESDIDLKGSRYTLADNSWTLGPVLDGLSGQVSLPQIASSGGGRAFLIWRQLEPPFAISGIYASTYDGGWDDTGPTTPIDDAAGPTEKPTLAVNTAGDAAYVWEERPNILVGSKYNIALRHYNATADDLALPILLDNPALDTHARNPRVAVAENGDAYVVWQQLGGGVINIYGRSHSIADGLLSPIWTIDQSGVNASDPQIILSGNQILVAYIEVGPTVNLMVRKVTLQEGVDPVWDDAMLLNPAGTSAGQFHLVNNAEGKVLAVWEQIDSACSLPAPCRSIFMNTYNGTSWAGALVAEADNATDARLPRAALNADGNGLIVWVSQTDSVTTVQTRGILIP